MRITSAPCAASARPQTGPAITRVRSSTRTPRAGGGGGGGVARGPRGGVFADLGDLVGGGVGARPALGVVCPSRRRAKHSGNKPGFGDGRLEAFRLPLAEGCGNRLAIIGAAQ